MVTCESCVNGGRGFRAVGGGQAKTWRGRESETRTQAGASRRGCPRQQCPGKAAPQHLTASLMDGEERGGGPGRGSDGVVPREGFAFHV